MDLSQLDEGQRAQVLLQAERQRHGTHSVDVPLSSSGDVLENFAVHEGVWNPRITSALYHAGYLFYNNHRLYTNRDALDMGTGTGIHGVVMAKCGAEHVTMTDVSPLAVENAKENAKRFCMDYRVDVVHGDLFENVSGRFSCIVFNLPFFNGTAEDSIGRSMLDTGETLRRFLREAPDYLTSDGKLVIPSYDLAGPRNDPSVQGLRHGYRVRSCWRADVSEGIQKGTLRMHELDVPTAS